MRVLQGSLEPLSIEYVALGEEITETVWLRSIFPNVQIKVKSRTASLLWLSVLCLLSLGEILGRKYIGRDIDSMGIGWQN